VPRFDYTTVGHVTADVLADGSRRPGGGAFYSALQAARLGQRTLIITQGVPSEIEALLAPYQGEFELEVHPAPRSTTLATTGIGRERRQRVLSWAGPMSPSLALDTAILHLTPVARETATSWQGTPEFIGLSAQGLVRTWAGLGAEIEHLQLAPEQLPRRCHAIVIGSSERASCEWLLEAVDAGGGSSARADGRELNAAGRGEVLLAVTAEADATALHVPGQQPRAVEVPRIERVVDDLGAGDVFAAAFFIALAEDRAPEAAAAFGNAAAAVRVAGGGPDAVAERDAIGARLGAGA
jgi:sugar/nucleoside kinase (ribokinase family)